MSTRAEVTFEITKWDEKPYNEIDEGPKLSRASVTKSYQGAIEGDGTLEMLIVHRPDGSAVFTGLERVRGRLADRSGSFVLQHSGTFQDGTVKATWTVVPDSGTGSLQGLRGTAVFEHGHAERYPVTFDYDFE